MLNNDNSDDIGNEEINIGDLRTELANLRKDKMALQQLLANSQEMLRIITDQSLINIMILQDGVIKYVNDVLPITTGYDKEEILSWGKEGFSKWIHPEDLEFVVEQARKKQKGDIIGVVTNYEFRLITKSGELKWMQLWSKTVDFDGKQADLVMAIDITDRKKVYEDLLKSEQEFRRLFQNSSDLILYIDVGGNILMANPSSKKMLGYDSYDLINKNLKQLPKEEGWNEFMGIFNEQISKANDKTQYTIKFKGKNGKIAILEISTHVNTKDGEIIGLQMFCRDITERKQLEDERIRMEQIESISLLAGGIAHDFNNILVGVLGNINLLQYDEKLTENQHSILKDMERATYRAADLTKQLLTFSKGGDPIKTCCSIHKIIEESLSFVLSGSKSTVEYSFSPKIPDFDIDKGQMSQVFNNLFINAIQAMPDGGKINVATTIVNGQNFDQLSLKNHQYVKISIQDNGIGIPDKEKTKIFDPYYSTKKNGTGLGLATCFSIISRHNGFITFESELGLGTTFYIYLPLTQLSCKHYLKNSAKSEVVHEIKNRKLNLLIMDDEEMVRSIFTQILEKLGHSVTTVINGSELIAQIKQSLKSDIHYDIIVLDLTIPGDVGGSETITELKKLDSNAYTVVASGYSNNPVMSKYRQYGFNNLLEKPFNFDKVKEMIDKFFADENER